jgi:hypothetical protein
MWTHGLAVLGLAALCGLWAVFQRWLAGRDPGIPGIEDGCGSCARVRCEEREQDAPPLRVRRRSRNKPAA